MLELPVKLAGITLATWNNGKNALIIKPRVKVVKWVGGWVGR